LFRKIGNQKHYQANSKSPVFEELASIVKKTVGLKQPLLEALEPISDEIDIAFIYGSIANATDTSSSDIDLMVVSDALTFEELFGALMELETDLGRTINPTLYKSFEFDQKRMDKKGYIATVLSSPTIMLIGSLNE